MRSSIRLACLLVPAALAASMAPAALSAPASGTTSATGIWTLEPALITQVRRRWPQRLRPLMIRSCISTRTWQNPRRRWTRREPLSGPNTVRSARCRLNERRIGDEDRRIRPRDGLRVRHANHRGKRQARDVGLGLRLQTISPKPLAICQSSELSHACKLT